MTISFIVLIALRMPVSMAIGLATLPPLLFLNRNLIVVPQFMLQGVHSTALLAVPFLREDHIIGGLIVKLGSRMVDGSLRAKLNTIRHAMKEVS